MLGPLDGPGPLRLLALVVPGALALVVCCSSCVPLENTQLVRDPWAKVTFDLARLNTDGLQGPPDGLRTLSYEFCIPDGRQYKEQVSKIDPLVTYMCGSPGRIGCPEDECLCIGDTHRPGWRDSLRGLAELPYIDRIDESFFE